VKSNDTVHTAEISHIKMLQITFYCLYTHFSTTLLSYKTKCITEKRRGVKRAYSGFLNLLTVC